jgi:plastocyanin
VKRTLATLGTGSMVLLLAFGLANSAVGGVSRTVVATKVTVTFSDRAFRFNPDSLNAGPTSFVVVNKGKRSHVLEITGPGLKGAHTAKLAAGKSTTLTVILRKGAYILSDPVGLSPYNVQYLDVAPAESVSAAGNSSTVAPPAQIPPMCGETGTNVEINP